MSDGQQGGAARLAARNGAVLLLLGLLTGGYVSAAMTGKLDVDPNTALAAHLAALMGAFWLFGLGWSMQFLSWPQQTQHRLVWLTSVANFSNWAVTAFKAAWKVKGVDAIGEVRNDTIFGVLTLLVVLPSLVAAGAWVYGFRARQGP